MKNILDSDLFEDKVPFYVQLSSVEADGIEVEWEPPLNIGHGYIKFHSGLEVPFFFEEKSGMCCAGADIKTALTSMALVLRECVTDNGPKLLGTRAAELLNEITNVYETKESDDIILGTDGVIHPPEACEIEDSNSFRIQKMRVGCSTFSIRDDLLVDIVDKDFSTKAFIKNAGCPVKSITVPYVSSGARDAILRTIGSAILCSAIDFIYDDSDGESDKIQKQLDDFNMWVAKSCCSNDNSSKENDFLTDVSFVLDLSAWVGTSFPMG